MMLALFSIALLAASPPNAPVFKFRGLGADSIFSEEKLRATGMCKDTSEGLLCTGNDNIQDWPAVTQLLVVDGRMARWSISGFRRSLPDVLPALEARYGTPCDQGEETVTNGFGSRIASATIVWCFRTGKLTFRERWPRVDSWTVEYVDDVVRPRAKSVRPDF